MNKSQRYLLPITLLFLVGIAQAQGPEPGIFHADGIAETDCGTERWAVKTLSDPDTSAIDFGKPYPFTVARVAQLPKSSFSLTQPRVEYEFLLCDMTALLYGYKIEDDGDIHMLLRDVDTDSTMVTEVPNPDCPEVKATSRGPLFTAVRTWLTDSVGKPTSTFKYLPVPRLVRVTGILFGDFGHGQTGMAANNWELHPVLSIASAGTSAVEDQKQAPTEMDLSRR